MDVNAPSGMNRQPWHFTVISNPEEIAAMGNAQKESMKKMSPPAPPKDMKPGEAGPSPPMPGGRGPKSGLGDSPVVIVISCNVLFNGDNKASYYEKFQIPEGQTIVAAILLGKTDNSAYDAVSADQPKMTVLFL